MAKIEVYVPWMFPDKWEQQDLEYIESKPEKTGMVFYFCGSVGDLRTFPGKIKNLPQLIKKYGDDDEKWKGLRFTAKTTEDKKNFILTPI